jgi:hypothetical protein
MKEYSAELRTRAIFYVYLFHNSVYEGETLTSLREH